MQIQAGAPVPVVQYTVSSQNVSYYDTYPGTVQALNEVELRSQVSGFITGIFFREGAQVSKGQKLYEIDRRKYYAVLEQARANVDIATANLAKAERDYGRYNKLNEQDAIASQIFDDAETALQNAKMQVHASKAALLNAETDYNYSIIKAPFAGTIGFSLVKPGAFVNAGQTLLNTISSDDPIGVDFIINEKLLPWFLALQHTGTGMTDSTFRITLADNSGYPDPGELSVIGRGVDPQTGTIRIRLLFPNHDRILRTGMNCKVSVLGESSGNQLIIPFKSVIEQMGEYFVYTIDSMKIKQVRVGLGPVLGDRVIVKTGLNPGDQIVLEGLQKVHHGSIVKAASLAEK